MVATSNIIPTEYPLTRTVCTILTGLQENNNYIISIQLSNSAVSGPASTDISVLTTEAGEYSPLLYILFRIINRISLLGDFLNPYCSHFL